MIKVGLIQPNYRQGPIGTNAYYLPYSVGSLWSYVSSREEIKNRYILGDIVFKREKIHKIVKSLAKHDILLFSTYVWNKEYNKALAKEVKSINPSVYCIFGGPEMPHEQSDIFKQYPDADIVIINEGEITLEHILRSYPKVEHCKGTIVKVDGEVIHNGPGDSVPDLAVLPSPYLDGTFDNLMSRYPDIEWNVTLESNRGCPYHCTFCDWGNMAYSKLRKFDINRVMQEMDWLSSKKTDYVTIADANFGIFKDRDAKIMNKLIHNVKITTYPRGLSITWAKNQTEATVNLAKKVFDAGLAGLTLSFQSTDMNVLSNIKRKNLEQSKAAEVMEVCNRLGVPLFSEAILGLPGQSLDSWKETNWELLRMGQHSSTGMYHAQLLVNAEMYTNQMKEFDIEYSEIPHYFANSDSPDEWVESSLIVKSTKDLPFEDLIKAVQFNWFITSFHQLGFSQIFSRYLYNRHNIDYSNFYNDLYLYLSLHLPWFKEDVQRIKDIVTKMFDGSFIFNETAFSDLRLTPWNMSALSGFRIYAQERYTEVFTHIFNFCSEYCAFVADHNNTKVLKYQTHFIIPYKSEQYPIITNYGDIHGIITKQDPKSDIVIFNSTLSQDIKLENFLDNIYFKRRHHYGKANIQWN